MFNIMKHMRKRKKLIISDLRDSGIPLLLTKETVHLLFEGSCELSRRLSRDDAAPAKDSPAAEHLRTRSRDWDWEPRSHPFGHGVHNEAVQIDEKAYVIQPPGVVSRCYARFLDRICDSYMELAGQVEIVETVCSHLLKLSYICSHHRDCSVHRRIFYQDIISDPIICVPLRDNESCRK